MRELILRPVIAQLTSALFGVASLAAWAREPILFYPTAINGGVNLIGNAAWRSLRHDKVIYSTGEGGPISSNAVVRTVASNDPNPGYWICKAKVSPGRTYLAGTWIRFSNAKILLRHFGTEADSGVKHEWRMYLFSGFNTSLEPYFSERTKALLSGDPNFWRPMFRLIRIDRPLKNYTMEIWHGLYLAAGEVSFSEPFLVDVTDEERSYTIDIETQRPISKIEVIRAVNCDSCWKLTFAKPTTRYVGRTPKSVDAFGDISLDGERLHGHVLVVHYTDGGEMRIASPESNIFVERR